MTKERMKKKLERDGYRVIYTINGSIVISSPKRTEVCNNLTQGFKTIYGI